MALGRRPRPFIHPNETCPPYSFKGIDLADAKAVAAAHGKAVKLGEPLSEELKAFARKNDIETFSRLVESHKTLRFLVDLPDREPILR